MGCPKLVQLFGAHRLHGIKSQSNRDPHMLTCFARQCEARLRANSSAVRWIPSFIRRPAGYSAPSILLAASHHTARISHVARQARSSLATPSVVVALSALVLELLAPEDRPLLVERDAPLLSWIFAFATGSPDSTLSWNFLPVSPCRR
jgi:hypothetical protein